jgi:hypothetical protein
MQARPKNNVTFRQIPFDVNWLDKRGFMTNAMDLLEEAERTLTVYVGYQLLDSPDLPEHFKEETNSQLVNALKAIHSHTVESQWNHAFQFRIGQGEIHQELVYLDRYHPAKEKFHPVNATARIRPEMISIFAVDRDWKRLDSDIAELKRLWPYEAYQPSANMFTWIDSMAFPDYCPIYVPRWYEHVRHHFDQLWSAFSQVESGEGRGVPAAYARGITDLARAKPSAIQDNLKRTTANHRHFLQNLQKLAGEVTYDRVLKGIHLNGQPVYGFYMTDEEYARIYPQALSMLQNVPL